jgi:hypothetical protein
MNRWTRKTFHGVLVIAAAMLLQVVPAAVHAAAPPELSGVWQGKLAVDASTSLTVQFTFTKGSNGAYTAVLNSPDNPALKDTATSGVSWDGTNLKLQVPTLSGSFAGAMKDGKLTGQWTQPGGNLPLVLAPYQKPVVTAAVARSITGAWNGPLTMGPNTQNVVFTFKQGAGGGLEGTLSIPDQGATLNMINVLFENGNLTLKIQQGQALFDFAGKVAGDQITGKLKIPAPQAPPDGVPLTLKRGEYKVVVPPLKLNAEAFAKVRGKWQGTMELTNNQTGAKQTIRLILRFETNAKGEYVAFVDSPDQNNTTGLVVSEATLTADKLEFKLPAIGGEFSGTVAEKTLTGDWAQPTRGFKQTLTLTRQ